MFTPYIDFVYKVTYLGETSGILSRTSMPPNATWADTLKLITWAGYEERWSFDFVRREWPSFTEFGGYPLFYTVKDGGVLSPKAANENLERTLDPDDSQFFIVGQEVNYEDTSLFCDHTGDQIPAAYGSCDEEES